MTWESSLYEGYGASICDLTRPRGKQTICQVRTYQDALLIVEAVNTLWPEAASPAEQSARPRETKKTTPKRSSTETEGAS